MTHRVFTDGIAKLRVEYLFPLAHLCNSPPQVVAGMRVFDFGRLIDGIDSYVAAMNAPPGVPDAAG